MNTIRLLLFFVIVLLLNPRRTEAQLIIRGPIEIGYVDSLSSEICGETRYFYIHKPDGEPNPDRPYPVLYVLDGDQFFTSVVGMVDHMSRAWGGSTLPKMIVVGIRHPNRFTDLTPQKPDTTLRSGVDFNESPFLSHLNEELIPYIENKYNAGQNRTLIGHSLGGLFVIYAMNESPESFDNYLSMDPSLWWEDQIVLKRIQSNWADMRLEGKSLFLGMADMIPPGVSLDSLLLVEDDATRIRHPQSIVSFRNTAENLSNGLDFNFQYYEGDTHVSCTAPAMVEGLRFLFKWFDHGYLMMSMLYESEDGRKVVMNLVEHYETASEKMGYPVFASADDLTGFARFLVRESLAERALYILNLAEREYSEDPVVYETLGWYFEVNSDYYKARESYEKAVNRGGGQDVELKVAEMQEHIDAAKN